MRSRLTLAALALLSAFALVFVLASTFGGSAPHGPAPQAVAPPQGLSFDGSLLPPGVPARNFALNDQFGRRVSLSSYDGRVRILTFLYSTCKELCPLIAQQIRGALDDLRRRVPTFLVSVDPAADTQANVHRFLEQVALSGRVEYLSGALRALRAIWRSYKIFPPNAPKDAFERSTYVLLIDRRGIERVSFPIEQLTPEGLAHDIRALEAD